MVITDLISRTIISPSELPVGANVIGVILLASTAQTALTISVGDADSAARYLAAGNTGLQTANNPVLCMNGQNYVVDGDDDQQIVITTAAATATAGVLSAVILYTQD